MFDVRPELAPSIHVCTVHSNGRLSWSPEKIGPLAHWTGVEVSDDTEPTFGQGIGTLRVATAWTLVRGCTAVKAKCVLPCRVGTEEVQVSNRLRQLRRRSAASLLIAAVVVTAAGGIAASSEKVGALPQGVAKPRVMLPSVVDPRIGPAAVYCKATINNCFGVTQTLSARPRQESGNPAGWTAGAATPIPGTQIGDRIQAMSCGGALPNCVAVGYDEYPFVITGPFGALAGVNRLSPHGALYSVSCVTAIWCAAVGFGIDEFAPYHGQIEPIVLAGNPVAWTAPFTSSDFVPTSSWTNPPNPLYEARLTSISCALVAVCVATGFAGNTATTEHPFVLHGSPASWSASLGVGDFYEYTGLNLGPPPSVLLDVDCATALRCTATGFDAPAAKYFEVSFPVAANVAAPVHLFTSHFEGAFAVWCRAGGPWKCVAVGNKVITGGHDETLTWSGAPGGWLPNVSTHSVLLPAAVGTYGYLNSVDCVSLVACVAVGFSNTSAIVLKGNPALWLPAAARRF
jgi:hypothetical protein